MRDSFEEKLEEYGDLILDPWQLDQRGVWQERSVGKGKYARFVEDVASPIPVLPTMLLKNMDTKTEKIELSFYKFGRWYKKVFLRSALASKNNIIKLADDGLEVNSDNAGAMVTYIAETVAKNFDTLPHKLSKSVLGWVGEDFMPYTDKIVFDGDDFFKHLYCAVTQRGNMEEWAAFIRPLRENIELRLCMAASFASPLIDRIGENPFVFHLWGGTGAGKSVALMVAMSVWGNPAFGQLTRTMNMTQNAMLSTAAFLKNLPFAGDELQTIKSAWSNYDQLIMRITEGIDRGRMSYDKVNETRSWKCSFIFSGEEPCVKQASGGGAKNRVIEVECRDRLVQDGNAVANFVRRHYGCAGRPYIEHIQQRDVTAMYSKWFNEILECTDTTDKQAGAMAIMLTADALASELFWPDEPPLTVSQIQPYLFSANEVDVSERAYQFVCDVVAENINNFSCDAKQVWGAYYPDRAQVYINKTVLCRLMSNEGFDFDAVKAKWVEKGYVVKARDGCIRHSRRINGVGLSCILLSLPRQDLDFEEITG